MDYRNTDTRTILKNMKNLITFTWTAAENAEAMDGEMDPRECATIMELLSNMADNLAKSIKADAAAAKAGDCCE